LLLLLLLLLRPWRLLLSMQAADARGHQRCLPQACQPCMQPPQAPEPVRHSH
jgi:hypothetical protein